MVAGARGHLGAGRASFGSAAAASGSSVVTPAAASASRGR